MAERERGGDVLFRKRERETDERERERERRRGLRKVKKIEKTTEQEIATKRERRGDDNFSLGKERAK